MKKKFSVLTIIFIFSISFLLLGMLFMQGTSHAKPDGKTRFPSINSLEYLTHWKCPDNIISEPLVFDDFELINGLEIVDLNRRRYIQLSEGSKKGRAEKYFFDNSAMYDIEIFYLDESNGKSVLSIIINDKKIGDVNFELFRSGNSSVSYSSSIRRKTFQGINIQKWSKIILEFSGDGDEKCRVEQLIITPVGDFNGKSADLTKPLSFRIFETAGEQLNGRKIFTDYVNANIDSLAEKRLSELAKLKTPAEWRPGN